MKIVNKKRGGFTWVEMLVLLVIIGVLAAIFYPAFNKGGGPSPRVSCAVNLKQIGNAFMQYAQEYDERFPPAKISDEKKLVSDDKAAKPFGWADAIFVYAQHNDVYHCPSEKKTAAVTDPTQSGYTDYWFNTNLSKLNLGKLNTPTRTIMLGDGNDGSENTDARYSLNALPQSWRDADESPARRHVDMACYAFADGHVKSFRPQQITMLPTTQSSSTFSIR